jgi:transcription-repair coupling factor (superfamily II helicase)
VNTDQFIRQFATGVHFDALADYLNNDDTGAISIEGLAGSAPALLAAACIKKIKKAFLFVLSDKESAAYFFNDLENLLGEKDTSYENRNSFFFPSSYKKPFKSTEEDNAGILLRSEVINRLATGDQDIYVVTYPEALSEKVLARKALTSNVLQINKGDKLSVDFVMEVLIDYGFEHADFVVEPGQFSLRGGIIDVFSFSNDLPFRIEIMDDTVESLRSFDTETQLSAQVFDRVSILPDIHALSTESENTEFLPDSMPDTSTIWLEDSAFCLEVIRNATEGEQTPQTQYADHTEIIEALNKRKVVEFRRPHLAKASREPIRFNYSPQPEFNKQFELLIRSLKRNIREGKQNFILYDSSKQVERIKSIFESLTDADDRDETLFHKALLISLHEGFIDHDRQIACYTDHQIFDRYHRFRIRDKFPGKQALSVKSLHSLKPGDYVTHIDYGIGIFSGLEKIEVNGRLQEAIRLIYKNNDVLYVSIHSMHRIAKYAGKEGTEPSLHRLGSNAWSKLKNKTKKKVKDIAHDLIRLYAKRKAQEGHAFSPDSYLQNELEASFIYEDTPDQEKATLDVKKDMESAHPMDRLICGDVGFGKTEVAIRAAFKAVTDSKQVAVLVPTTILAMQHYYTFTDRLKDFPCTIDYVSRFRSASEKKAALAGAKKGSVDILIGTHRLLSKDVSFKDLGLLIIDEEQKFGVSSKEKLKQLRVNVDTLTMTATPIPRTLQFSLMGARDLSYINTPPPNRYPIITEVHVFNEALIREAIMYEINRGGQVFFVHNRVHNIAEVASIIKRNCPGVRVAIGHGQLEGSQLEKVMVSFINGDYDVLVSTTIIESGLDIPNANTIIINNAHHFGLSDLHQMRGRVGRTNKKAFCYLLSQPLLTLTDEARKRLRAIEEFSELGSGFNIAMRDLDIRGAGNLLGAEQSGFITELGYETYQKILDEAMSELREQEYKELFANDKSLLAKAPPPVFECQVETDLELMIPSDYITNIEERLQLYKELDSIPGEKELINFSNKLTDRFGPLPEEVSGLLKVIRLRWRAKEVGIAKIILKKGKIIAHLPDSERTDYYQGEAFGKILHYAQMNPQLCTIREANSHLTFIIHKAETIDDALQIITDLSTHQ